MTKQDNINKSTLPYTIVAILISATFVALFAGYLGLKIGPIYEKNRQCCGLIRLPNLFSSLKEFAGFIEFHSKCILPTKVAPSRDRFGPALLPHALFCFLTATLRVGFLSSPAFPPRQKR